MIKTYELTKKFGHITAISDVSFEIEKGEVVGFLGPNAAGKTTTMRILTCYIPPTTGRAEIAGFDILTSPLEVRKRIGYLPENIPLYPYMETEEYLDFIAKLKKVSRERRKNHLEEIMEKCGLVEVSSQLTGTLSKGYKQRVGVAQAIIGDPEVLILDEPTIGLDPKQIIEIREMIKELGREHTVILSTHILPEVSMTCDRVMIINEGKIIAMGTTEELTKKIKSVEKISLKVKGDKDKISSRLKLFEDVVNIEIRPTETPKVNDFIIEAKPGKDIREKLASTIIRNKWDLLELKQEVIDLEDIFLKLTSAEEEQRPKTKDQRKKKKTKALKEEETAEEEEAKKKFKFLKRREK